MESSKRKITLKVLVGYLTLGVLVVVAGWMILREIRSLTTTQYGDLKDRNKVIKIGGLIADIYENESLARAALQLNSASQFDAYIAQNDTLLKTLDTLRIFVDNAYQKQLLDSIKVVFAQKHGTMNELRRIKANNSSEKSIEKTIEKLNSIDPILGKLSIEDYVESPETLSPRTREILEKFIAFSNGLNAKDSLSKINQTQIDSIVTASKALLKKVQEEASQQKASLHLKERELIENDLMTSRQLRHLLSALETEMVTFSQDLDRKRQESLDRSINILIFAAGVSFLLVIVFSVIVLNDFWKSQKYRQQLEASNDYTSALLKSREQLIHMVSHDLRSPLSTIAGYSELLQKASPTSKDDYYLSHIKSASNYMTQLVEDLLEFSKLESDKIAIETVPFNLTSLIKETSETIKVLHTDKAITTLLDLDAQLDRTILSDPFRIKQILYNLIGNAYKFTPQGTITITSKLESSDGQYFAQVTVEDTGIGISAEQQEDIFKAFTQVSHPMETQQGGFGLGLAITKRLVDLLHGRLTLKSELGAGSAFHVSIPIKLSDKPMEKPRAVTGTPAFNLQAVVVDDDPSMRQLIVDILTQHGMTVHAFEDGKAALADLATLPFDVVLTDIQLPKMNGFHFMETIKQQPYYKQQPIIAMTGRADMEEASYMESGFATVIFKPFSAERVSDVLAKHFPDAIMHPEPSRHPSANASKLFDTRSISGFVNHDETALKSVLKTFYEDTQQTMAHLEKAMKLGDVKTVHTLSHRMLGMFKQLKIQTLVPQLEALETSTHVTHEDFHDLKAKLAPLYAELSEYLNQDRTP